ncbi:PH domain-containing protein [Plasmodiophora brassicae]
MMGDVAVEGMLWIYTPRRQSWTYTYGCLHDATLYEFRNRTRRRALRPLASTDLTDEMSVEMRKPLLYIDVGRFGCLSCPGQHLIYPLVLRSPTLQESIVVAAASADSQMRWFSAIQSAIETPKQRGQGFLLKLGGRLYTRWQRRYFRIRDGRLEYYYSGLHEPPVKSFPLDGGRVMVSNVRLAQRPFVFGFQTKDGSVAVLCASDGETRRRWISSIRLAILRANRRLSAYDGPARQFHQQRLVEKYRQSGQALALSGSLQMKISDCETINVICYLFSSVLAVLDETSIIETDVPRLSLPLTEAYLYRDREDCSDNAFSITAAGAEVVLLAKSPAEKDMWVSNMILSIQQCMLQYYPERCQAMGWTHAILRGTIHSYALLDDTESLLAHVAGHEGSTASGIDARDSMGLTALHIASHEGLHDIVRVLIEECGASPLSRNADYQTPLHLACSMGHVEVVEILCRHLDGPGISATNGSNRSSLWCALWSDTARAAECVRLLVEHGADVNAIEPASGMTLLQEAVIREEEAAVDLLLEIGASTSVVSMASKTAVEYATVLGSLQIVTTLSKQDAARQSAHANGNDHAGAIEPPSRDM